LIRTWLKPGPLFHVAVIHFAVTLAYSFYLLYGKIITARGVSRNQLVYVFAGTSIGFLGGSTNFLSWYRVPIPPYLNILVSFGVLIITYAIMRYRLLDIKIAVTRSGIFAMVYGTILAIPFLIGILGKAWFQSRTGENWWIPLIIMTIFVAAAGPMTYNFLIQRAEDKLLKKQRRTRDYLRSASRGMLFVRDLEKLQNLIVHILTRGINVSHVRLFIYNPDTDLYEPRASRGIERRIQTGRSLGSKHSLIRLLNKIKKDILCEEIVTFKPDGKIGLTEVENEMRAMGAALILPHFIQNGLTGFLSLGAKKDGQAYSQDDISVLTALANQAALAIENAQFYQKIREQEAILLRTCKLSLLGEMTSGFVHQINNPLLGIILAAGNTRIELEESQNYVENNSHEISETVCMVKKNLTEIEEKATRTSEIINSILRFTVPQDFHETDIKETVESGLKLIPKNIIIQARVTIEKDISGYLPKVKARTVELEQVFMNICINGIEAMKDKGGLLRIEARTEEGLNFVKIKISDTGCGIHPKNLPRIYDFFFTTKGSPNTGLGLPLVYKIIKECRGKVEVKSKLGKGTAFSVYVPVWTGFSGGKDDKISSN
jgi:signal transduction histidine kinase